MKCQNPDKDAQDLVIKLRYLAVDSPYSGRSNKCPPNSLIGATSKGLWKFICVWLSVLTRETRRDILVFTNKVDQAYSVS